MTNTQAELREKIANTIDRFAGSACDADKLADAILTLLPPAPAVGEAFAPFVKFANEMLPSYEAHSDDHAYIIFGTLDGDVSLKIGDFRRLAALGEGGAWSGWHPMSEAPKDGSEFLGIYWNPDHGHEPDYSLLRWDDQVKAFVGYCDGERSIKSEGDRWTDYHTPFCTHWCPLPEPKPLGDAPIPPSEGE